MRGESNPFPFVRVKICCSAILLLMHWWCVSESRCSPLGNGFTDHLPELPAFTHHEKLRATRFTPVALEKKRIHWGLRFIRLVDTLGNQTRKMIVACIGRFVIPTDLKRVYNSALRFGPVQFGWKILEVNHRSNQSNTNSGVCQEEE